MEIFRGRSLSLKIAQASLRKPPRSVFPVENSVNHVGHLLLRPLLTTLRTVTGRMGSTAEKCPVTRRRPGGPAWTTLVSAPSTTPLVHRSQAPSIPAETYQLCTTVQGTRITGTSTSFLPAAYQNSFVHSRTELTKGSGAFISM
jgi:D-alanyl-D-alanine carboxypeptidase